MTAKIETLAIHGGQPVKTTPFGAGPKHGLDEWRAIRPIFERGAIHMTRGPEVMKLRQAFCKPFGRKYAVTASSGTAALHAALGALEVGRGDEVITSPITDMGTLVPIWAQNAVPIFADVDPRTLEITPATIEAKITRRTRAIIVVHLAGLAADMRGIMRLARRHKIAVVEDVAQSYLCTQGKRLAGTFGDIGCWSLNESKHIGAGDGGVLLTNNKALANRADLFADKCYDRDGTGRDPYFATYNYRLNTLVAGVCLEQLKKVRRVCRRRNTLGTRLDRGLDKIEGIYPRPVRKGDYATYWYYLLHVDPDILGCTNDQFASALKAEGVWAREFEPIVLNWSVLKDHIFNPHACADRCPLYKGPTPDYNILHYPGLMEVQHRAVQMGINEFHTAQDVRDVLKAVAKVARWYRSRQMPARAVREHRELIVGGSRGRR